MYSNAQADRHIEYFRGAGVFNRLILFHATLFNFSYFIYCIFMRLDIATDMKCNDGKIYYVLALNTT